MKTIMICFSLKLNTTTNLYSLFLFERQLCTLSWVLSLLGRYFYNMYIVKMFKTMFLVLSILKITRHWVMYSKYFAILLGNMLLLKNPNDAQLASLTILRKHGRHFMISGWCVPYWFIFLNKIIKQWTIKTFTAF